MKDDPISIGHKIRSFEPTDGLWSGLEDLLERLWATEEPERAMDDLYSVLERYPEGEDGGGVFWSILHGVEDLPSYEEGLVISVRRQPSEFTTIMINRILNSGEPIVAGISASQLLEEVSRNPESPQRVSELALDFLERANSLGDD